MSADLRRFHAGADMLDNQEYKKLLGDLRGREPAQVLTEAILGQAGTDPIAACLAGQGFKNLEISLETPNGRGPRWFSCSGTPADEPDPSARGYFASGTRGDRQLLLIATEITARRREMARAHLENLRARLAEQQLIQGMHEALAAAIYQLQAPMNVIHAASVMVRCGTASLETLAAMLDQICASGARALETLRGALPEEPHEAEAMVNVNELLRQVLDLETDRLLAAGIVVDWRPAEVLPALPGHENQLRSVFKELIENAIHALNESGRMNPELLLHTRALEGAVAVEIQDNGVGIPGTDRYKVFEPFHIGWRSRRGKAGMGLAIAQEIVNAHGGSIEVDPGFPDGCRMRLFLSSAKSAS